ncbi:MAG: MBL fold metallo-hydrolase [Streptosporangiales bacterium]|nr:MBL fold metallo-hydrolase [Streptosporangiales bacterium]
MTYTGDVEPEGPSDVRELTDIVIRKTSVGTMDNNAYLLTDRATGAQLLVDAADNPKRLSAFVEEGSADGRLDVIVTTHQHWDHHRALEALDREKTPWTAAGRDDSDAVPVTPDQELADGDQVAFGEQRLRVIHLVGHTPGSVALLYDDPHGHPHLFTGDSLFPGGPGRTTTPAAFTSLMNDLERKVFGALPDDTWVYPGHGKDTTLGAERPHLGEWRARGW